MGSQNISSLKAHFDFKTDKGSTAVDIRPSYAEMLEKLSMEKQKFDETIEKKLYSPHQKTESTLSNVSSSSSKKPILNQDGVLSDEAKRNVQKFANLVSQFLMFPILMLLLLLIIYHTTHTMLTKITSLFCPNFFK